MYHFVSLSPSLSLSSPRSSAHRRRLRVAWALSYRHRFRMVIVIVSLSCSSPLSHGPARTSDPMPGSAQHAMWNLGTRPCEARCLVRGRGQATVALPLPRSPSNTNSMKRLAKYLGFSGKPQSPQTDRIQAMQTKARSAHVDSPWPGRGKFPLINVYRRSKPTHSPADPLRQPLMATCALRATQQCTA